MTATVACPIAVAKAFSPGHITGFVAEKSAGFNNYLDVGSTGAGFSIEDGITTTVEIHEHKVPGYQVSINGFRVEDAPVSKWVAAEYIRLTRQYCYINIKHECRIPVGFGLGSSGAGALSLSYALNQALDAGLCTVEAAQIAHQAEIACKTGLGSVIAEFAGGFEMRIEAGAPGIGIIEKLELKNYKAIIFAVSPISTKSFLIEHPNLGEVLCEKMLEKLRVSKDVSDFLNMSYSFAHYLGLTEGKTKLPIQKLKSQGFECGIALFGETIFTIVPNHQIMQVKDCLRNFDGKLIVCNIDNTGARML